MGTSRLERRNRRARSESLINLQFSFCSAGRSSPVTILTTLITCKFGCQLSVRSHRSFTKFARDFDCAVASTIFAAPLIRDASKEAIPHIWWIQEGLVGNHYLNKYSVLPSVLGLADLIITPDQCSRRIYQAFARRPIRVVPYGIPDVARGRGSRQEGRVCPLRLR